LLEVLTKFQEYPAVVGSCMSLYLSSGLQIDQNVENHLQVLMCDYLAEFSEPVEIFAADLQKLQKKEENRNLTFEVMVLGFDLLCSQEEISLVCCSKIFESLNMFLNKAKSVPNAVLDAIWKFILKMCRARNFEITEDCLRTLQKFPRQ
jgi:hypothetical protein